MGMKDLRVSVGESGCAGAGAGAGFGDGDGDGLVWRRYSDVVHEVVSLWCQDVNAFDLDPLWLLPKLRAHKSW